MEGAEVSCADYFFDKDDSLWAAFEPVFDDLTIQYGSSSLALNFCPSKVNSLVRFSSAVSWR